MTAAMHRFPSADGGEKKPVPTLRPQVTFETFEPDQARALLDVAQQRLAGAQVLVAFIDANRDLARYAGVETIGIELVAVMEGDRFSRVLDALEGAVEEGDRARISTDGLAILKRVETLLAEASMNIRRFTEGDFSAMEMMEAQPKRDVDYHMACLPAEESRLQTLREDLSLKEKSAARQAATLAAVKAAISANPSSAVSTARSMLGLGQSKNGDFQIWIPLAIFGVIVLAATIIAVVAKTEKAGVAEKAEKENIAHSKN
jgi:hypothetical protein